jgi:hypothetical protein
MPTRRDLIVDCYCAPKKLMQWLKHCIPFIVGLLANSGSARQPFRAHRYQSGSNPKDCTRPGKCEIGRNATDSVTKH